MTPAQIKTLVAEYVNASLEEVEAYSLTHTRTDDEREGASLAITDILDDTRGELLSNDWRRVSAIADGLLAKHRLTVAPDSLDWQRLCRGLLVGLQAMLKTELRGLDGDYTDPDPSPNIPPMLTPSKLFSEASTLYFSEHTRAARTDSQIKAEFARFLSVIGGDKPLGDITKADCRRYKETLQQSRSSSTVNKHLHSLTHLFTWASGQGFVAEDYQPVKGLLVNKRSARNEKQTREPFTDAQLTQILSHPEFMKQRTGKHPERYWMVLCLLFTGARREEIAQLATADIKEGEGLSYFNITNEGDGQALKTQGSKRRVPIHADLECLGFLAYVKTMKRSARVARQEPARLFPQLKKGANGYGDAVGKWFARLLRQHLTLTDPALVLHSLRHTVTTRLTAAGVPQDMREVLVGHASETVHGSTYVHRDGIPLSLLKEHLEKLVYRVPLAPSN